MRLKILISQVAGIALLTSANIRAADSLMVTISGEQRVFVNFRGTNSLVQSNTFLVRSAGTNWSTITDWPAPAATRAFNAFVDGLAYMANSDPAGSNTGGFVPAKPEHMIEGMTSAQRMLFVAFLASRENQAALRWTNFPVPFLNPRHPAIWSYAWNIQRFDEPPFLPRSVRFTLDPKDVEKLPLDAVEHYYRNAWNARRELQRFAATQTGGATYETTGTTNAEGHLYPLNVKVTATHYEENAAMQRTFEIVVTNIKIGPAVDLKPPLLPGSYVQHVVAGTTYMYNVPSDGHWLTADEARQTGQALNNGKGFLNLSRPALFRFWKWWTMVACILLLLILAPLVWFLWRRHKRDRATLGQY